MRNWHSLFEILKYPLEIIFVASFLLGIGNLLNNPEFGIAVALGNEYVYRVAGLFTLAGRFLFVNFPILIMLRLSSYKHAEAVTILSCFVGYVAYLIATMCFTTADLSSSAFSSILGLSTSSFVANDNSTRYPLQTGIIGSTIIAVITLYCYRWAKKKKEKSSTWMSWQITCTVATVALSFVAGIVMSFVWPYVFMGIQKMMNYIAVDTTSPLNLGVYGFMDGLLNTFGLGTIIRQPFWYGTSGGTWVNLAGASLTGDVTIWTSQYLSSGVNGLAGRFITPYFVLNLFALPGMIWALFSLDTNPQDKQKRRVLVIIATAVSLFSGTLLPMELMLLVLCPLLFVFHLVYTGVLFAILPLFHCCLGYISTNMNVISALPGSLPEFLVYVSTPSLQMTVIEVVVAGVISAIIYFVMTRLYFKHMAIDLFGNGKKKILVNGTVEAVGGIENIKMVQSSMSQLMIEVYDTSKVNTNQLMQLGAARIYETKIEYRICYGSASTMVRYAIAESMRQSIRRMKVREKD